MNRPFVLGLTGSIGMGKSAVAAILRQLGVPVFDADDEVRRMQERGGSLVAPIEAAFPGTTGPGGIDRAKVGAAVFGNRAALARLESIVHPAVRARRAQFLAGHRTEPLVVLDIPLLFETGGLDHVDAILVVSAPSEIQRTRVLARPGMTEERFAQILALQLPDAEKRARADYIIETGGTLESTRDQVAALVEKLTG